MARIVALAGRRIDAEGVSEPRFPPSNEKLVRQRLRAQFLERKVEGLVCAAACGVDLVALEVAGELGIARRVVLPAPVTTFRENSVVDRPGNWGARFDHVIREVDVAGGLITHELGANDEGYRAGNLAILDAAQALGGELEAWIVWNGKPRDSDDITLHFADSARERNLLVHELSTLP